LPFGPEYGEWGFSTFYSGDSLGNLLDDLDKIFGWVSGQKTKRSSNYALSEHYAQISNGTKDLKDKVKSQYFSMQVFKKGTVHIYVKPEYLKTLQDINAIASKNKKWLGYGRK
jgi:hypothetical protein